MYKLARHIRDKWLSRAFCMALLLFITGSGNASARSSYGMGFGIHNYGYHGHYSVGAHYNSHGDIGTAGYVILGLFGVALLTHILNYDNYRNHGTYHRTAPYQPPLVQPQPAPAARSSGPVYNYDAHDGWDALANGNYSFALDVFAVQLQKDMSNGVPRVGFALAAATGGELDRGARSMRKALSIDPDAINEILLDHELEVIIDLLIEEYAAAATNNDNDFDNSFMIASLSSLKKDYTTAKNVIADSDQSQSAVNLRNIISSNL